LLRMTQPPLGTDVIIGNSWNAFAFWRNDIPLITVERLFVLDSEIYPYKSFAQAAFHDSIVRYGMRRSYAVSSRVIALSEASARSITKVFPWVSPSVIRNAVDIGFFSSDGERPPLEGRDVRILFVGNLSRRKGVDLLIPILDALGDGFVLECATGRDDCRRLREHPRIRTLGRLTLTDVRKAYRRSDVLLLPSRLEGMPRVAMEALACGTPVVASNVSSLPEVVLHGVNGFTCARDSVLEYAEAIRNVTRDQKLYDRMSTAARESAEQRHDLKKMAQAYVECVEGLMQRRRQ